MDWPEARKRSKIVGHHLWRFPKSLTVLTPQFLQIQSFKGSSAMGPKIGFGVVFDLRVPKTIGLIVLVIINYFSKLNFSECFTYGASLWNLAGS